MISSDGPNGDRDAPEGVVRRALRTIWETEELSHTATKNKIVVTAILYGLAIAACITTGLMLWFDGQTRTAYLVWIVGNGFFLVFGTITVGWNILEYLDIQRAARREEPVAVDRDRDLAPNVEFSRDAKIAFGVTVLVILEIVVVVKTSQAVL